VPEPVTTPSPGIFCSAIPKSAQLCSTNMSYSSKLPGSSRTDSRSRAVSRPLACCAAMRFSPPPSRAPRAVSPVPRWSSPCSGSSRPHLPEGTERRDRAMRRSSGCSTPIRRPHRPIIAWYYTPMMLPFSRDLDASVTVFDAMDELSKFKFAPPSLLDLEQELIERADLVFTGGSSLYEAKKDRHDNVHLFPSSVDRAHFERPGRRCPSLSTRPGSHTRGSASTASSTSASTSSCSTRSRNAARLVVRHGRPGGEDSPDDLPRRPNIHYLGGKKYEQLPAYLSGWDVALMPFAMNESTSSSRRPRRPEYLAGGKPVVSTPVRDVVRHYGHLEGVGIARRRELRRRSASGCSSSSRQAIGSPKPTCCCPRPAGHHPGADGGADRRGLATRHGAERPACWWRGMSAADPTGAQTLRLSRRRRRLCRLGHRRAAGQPARRAGAADRPPQPHRRQCL
jgi:hypothetical protein